MDGAQRPFQKAARTAGILALALTWVQAGEAAAQDPPPETCGVAEHYLEDAPDPEGDEGLLRVGTWLAEQERSDVLSHWIGGGVLALAGVGAGAGGIALANRDRSGEGLISVMDLLTGVLLYASPYLILQGISLPLLHAGPSRRIAAEWRETPPASRSAASFVDPVRWCAEHQRTLRRTAFVVGATTILFGLGWAATVYATDLFPERDRAVWAGVLGGTPAVVGLGVILVGLLLSEEPARAWEQRELRYQLAPNVSSQGAGLSFTASF